MSEQKLEVSVRKWLESDEYRQIKEKLQKELAKESEWIPVDRTTFEMSSKQRIDLENAKLKHRRELKKYYGEDANKHLNIPSNSMSTVVHWTF